MPALIQPLASYTVPPPTRHSCELHTIVNAHQHTLSLSHRGGEGGHLLAHPHELGQQVELVVQGHGACRAGAGRQAGTGSFRTGAVGKRRAQVRRQWGAEGQRGRGAAGGSVFVCGEHSGTTRDRQQCSAGSGRWGAQAGRTHSRRRSTHSGLCATGATPAPRAAAGGCPRAARTWPQPPPPAAAARSSGRQCL